MPVNRNSSLKSSTGSAIVLERMQEELAEVSGARNSSCPSIRIRYYDHHFLLFGKSVRRVLPPPPPAYGLYARVNDENDGRPLTNSLGGLGHLRCLVVSGCGNFFFFLCRPCPIAARIKTIVIHRKQTT